jgi:hypothetical protein
MFFCVYDGEWLQDDFKYVSRCWSHKVVKKERQSGGRFEMNETVKRKVKQFIDAYFVSHSVYIRPPDAGKKEKATETKEKGELSAFLTLNITITISKHNKTKQKEN